LQASYLLLLLPLLLGVDVYAGGAHITPRVIDHVTCIYTFMRLLHRCNSSMAVLASKHWQCCMPGWHIVYQPGIAVHAAAHWEQSNNEILRPARK
jgi:hypothetical protein